MLTPPQRSTIGRSPATASRSASREREANEFAAALLMPAAWITRDVRARTSDPSILGRVYSVSEAAVTFRLRKLGLT